MRHFLLQLGIFSVFFTVSCLGVFSLADGSTDAFYVKFTTPKQTSLIVGSSRAAQGLQPSVINSFLENSNIYNYAFSRIHTPFGSPYYRIISKKLNKSSEGVFIIEVSPWTISYKKDDNFKTVNFEDELSFAGKIKNVNSKPNLDYLIRFYNQRNIHILKKKFSYTQEGKMYVMSDGWLKVNFSDMFSFEKLNKSTILSYKKIKDDYIGLSKLRLEYLNKIIELLKQHGDVYLVRLPIDNKMLVLEEQLMPDFNYIINTVSEEHNVPYINAMPFRNAYKYIDGHHLTINSGKVFSEFIAQEIKNYELLNK